MKNSTVEVMVNALVDRNKGKSVDTFKSDLGFTLGFMIPEIEMVMMHSAPKIATLVYKEEPIVALDLNEAGQVIRVVFDLEVIEKLVDLKKFGFECPTCGDGHMHYDPLPNAMSTSYKLTHLFICDTCPAVLMEWYDRSDSDVVAKGMAGEA